jgi:hypothetical protein
VPARRLLKNSSRPSIELTKTRAPACRTQFDGSLQSLRALVQTTPDLRFALNADYTLNRLSHIRADRRSVSTHLLGLETRVAANPRLQFVTVLQWNIAARQVSGNVRLTWEHRPLAFFNVIYKHRAPAFGLGSATAPLESRQLLVECTWLIQL